VQYAQRAVQQYNLGVSHPQCNIKVDLRWQPVYENHFTACMHSPKFLMDSEQATRDNILRSCGAWDGNTGVTAPSTPPPAASGPPPPPPAATPSAPAILASLPTQMAECEHPNGLNVCGQWVWTGQAYSAHWANGAVATITVTRFDGHSVAFHRVDLSNSISVGLTSDMQGQVSSDGHMSGSVTWTWPAVVPPVAVGTWDATFTPMPAAAPVAPPPSAVPTPSAAPTPPTGSVTGTASQGTMNVFCGQNAELDGYSFPSPTFGSNGKVIGGVLSYTDTTTNKPVSFIVMRPAGFRPQANCQGEMAIAGIWLSQKKVFRLIIVPGLSEVMAQDLPKASKTK
jgi:hypothetical protein